MITARSAALDCNAARADDRAKTPNRGAAPIEDRHAAMLAVAKPPLSGPVGTVRRSP
jgi:hypothetical protein